MSKNVVDNFLSIKFNDNYKTLKSGLSKRILNVPIIRVIISCTSEPMVFGEMAHKVTIYPRASNCILH